MEAKSIPILKAPDGSEIHAPLPVIQKRHLWVFGPSGTHKTLWLKTQVLQRLPSKCFNGSFPIDKYRGEEIVYWDDAVPELKDLLRICSAPGMLAIVVSAASIDETFPDQQAREKLHNHFIEYDMALDANHKF